ncbi:MAG: hypothetical protein ACRC8S_17765 [Fimbriiglobus sp.]
MAWASSPCVKRLPLPIRTAKMAVPPENLDAPDKSHDREGVFATSKVLTLPGGRGSSRFPS